MFGSRRRQRALEQRIRDYEEHYGLVPSVPEPPRGSRLSGFLALLAVAGVTLSAVYTMQPRVFPDRVHELLGTAPERLLPARDITTGSGEYSFMATQPGSDEPVSYDPCTVIEVAINPAGAPEDHQELVETSLQRTSEATGFEFELVGTTEDRHFNDMSVDDPVMVLWADEEEVPELAGDVAGVGGSYRLGPEGGPLRYVTGFVVLDTEAFDSIRSDSIRQAIVDHEFAHLVGLGHVEDRHQLMHESGGVNRGYGNGDLAGLAALGAVPCR